MRVCVLYIVAVSNKKRIGITHSFPSYLYYTNPLSHLVMKNTLYSVCFHINRIHFTILCILFPYLSSYLWNNDKFFNSYVWFLGIFLVYSYFGRTKFQNTRNVAWIVSGDWIGYTIVLLIDFWQTMIWTRLSTGCEQPG